MPYKRRSQFSGHFLSLDFGEFHTKKDFFNRHSRLHSLSKERRGTLRKEMADKAVLMSDFDILTTTRAWVAVPWDFNSCIGLRFRRDGSGDMVFSRLQVTRADMKFRFLLQPPNELKLIYQELIAWKSLENSFPKNERGKAIHYSLTEIETVGVTANIGPFTFCWTLSLGAAFSRKGSLNRRMFFGGVSPTLVDG